MTLRLVELAGAEFRPYLLFAAPGEQDIMIVRNNSVFLLSPVYDGENVVGSEIRAYVRGFDVRYDC